MYALAGLNSSYLCFHATLNHFVFDQINLALPVDNPPPNTKTLPRITEAQMTSLQAAKKYCLEATVRHVSCVGF